MDKNREIVPKVKYIMNKSQEEAKHYGDNYVRQEHILLSISWNTCWVDQFLQTK